jgi:acetate kinase
MTSRKCATGSGVTKRVLLVKILVLNSGSSSQKSALYEIGGNLPEHPPMPLWEGKIEWSGERATVQTRARSGASKSHKVTAGSREKAIEELLSTLWSGKGPGVVGRSDIDVVGHRIVHGGTEFCEPVAITPEVKAGIGRMAAFAPLHNRAELEGIKTIEKQMSGVAQVAVFDTGFHRTLPESARVYPGPYEWLQRGIRRYGFHGINHAFCAGRAAQLLGRDVRDLKTVSCHLGNGCSLAAIDRGRSVDTTMGFTPLEGLMMGTRSGSIDPGILTFLMREASADAGQLDDVLNKKAGLLGISGASGDMREIVSAMKAGNERARLAFEIFVHRLRKGIGEMIAVLGGCDALVFTAGIGENSAEVRAATCETLGFAGVRLDVLKNQDVSPDAEISGGDSRVRILVLRAQEDWSIAQECWRLMRLRDR